MAPTKRGRSRTRTPKSYKRGMYKTPTRSRSRSRPPGLRSSPPKYSITGGVYTPKARSRSRYSSASLSVARRGFTPSTDTGYKGAFNKTTTKINGIKEKCLTQGVVFNREVSSVLTGGPSALYIGHCTNPADFTSNVLWLAIVKKFLLLIGVQVNDTQKPLYDIAEVGNQLNVVYKASYDSDGLSSTNYVCTATTTMVDIATAFSTFFNNSATPLDQAQFDCIIFTPSATNKLKKTRMILKNARVVIHSVSNFTIQNRTKSDSSDDSADQVDNQPLRGFTYFGYGSGTQMNTTLPQSVKEFVCDDFYGILRKAPTVGEVELGEPPSQLHFGNVKKSGSQELDVGVVKNSKLIFDKTISVNSLHKQITCNPNRGHTYHKLGKFKFFGFEKMIDIELSLNMSLAFEHNLNMGMYIIPGSEKYSNQVNEKYYI